MRIVNLTPHVLNVHVADGSVRDIPPSGTVARVATIEIPADPEEALWAAYSRGEGHWSC